ncbi:hypothetical protein KCV03_g9543, partial [Aureobasidium melanogenum]
MDGNSMKLGTGEEVTADSAVASGYGWEVNLETCELVTVNRDGIVPVSIDDGQDGRTLLPQYQKQCPDTEGDIDELVAATDASTLEDDTGKRRPEPVPTPSHEEIMKELYAEAQSRKAMYISHCIWGKVRELELLFRQYPDDHLIKHVNAEGNTGALFAATEEKANHYGRTPLMEAALWGRLGTVQYLTQQRDVNFRLRDGNNMQAKDLAEDTSRNRKERMVRSGGVYREPADADTQRKQIQALLERLDPPLPNRPCTEPCRRTFFHRNPDGTLEIYGPRTLLRPPYGGMQKAFATLDRVSLEYTQDLLTQDRRLSLQEQEAAGKLPREFSLNALELQARNAVNAERVINTERIVDTENSKTYAMTMDNGKKVIVKALESTDEAEPATMTFARDVLKLPVPDVLGSCHFGGFDLPMDAVGAGFIIMSKPKGVLLSKIWDGLTQAKRAATIRSIIQYQSTWTSWSPQGYGSVFVNVESPLVNSYCRPLPLPEDLGYPEKLAMFDGSSYVLGPVLTRVRKHDKIPYPIWRPFCGPWITTKGYLDKAPGDALPILRRLQKPTDWQQNPTLSSFAYQFMSTFRSKFKAIRVYQALVPRLIANHGELLRPMLRNPNLRTDSIFVDSKDSSKITGFIDWQCSEIVPAYKQIQQPTFHIASKSNGSKRQEAPRSSSQTVFELFASLGDTERPDVIQQLAFRNSIEYTLLEQAEDMLNTDSTEFLALAEEYLKLHPKYVSSLDDLLMSHPRRRRYLKQKPRQEYIAEQLSLYKKG